MKKIPGLFVLLALIFAPPLGIVLIVINMILPKVIENNSKNQDIISHDENLQPNEYQSTNDDYYDYKEQNQTPKQTFHEAKQVRCDNCQSLNFVDQLPYTCEFCGHQITKI